MVENRAVQVRTVSGPQPLEVLRRRLDAYADPLELDETSRIGTHGLVDAMRQSKVNMVNALGSGNVETRASLAFQPKFAEVLPGGTPAASQHRDLVVRPARRECLLKESASRTFPGEALSRTLPFDIGNAGGLQAKPAPLPPGPCPTGSTRTRPNSSGRRR